MLDSECAALVETVRRSLKEQRDLAKRVSSAGSATALRALEDQVKACDERILGLIEEARSALDTIDVIASRKKEAGGPEVGE